MFESEKAPSAENQPADKLAPAEMPGAKAWRESEQEKVFKKYVRRKGAEPKADAYNPDKGSADNPNPGADEIEYYGYDPEFKRAVKIIEEEVKKRKSSN